MEPLRKHYALELLILRLALLGIVGLVILYGLIHWLAPSSPVSATAASIPAPAPPAASPTKIAAPNLVPPVPNGSSVAVQPDAAIAPVDPQADLKTALPDLARLTRSGDLATRFQLYTPPDRFTPEALVNLQNRRQEMDNNLAMASPDLQAEMRRNRQQITDDAAKIFEDAAGETPDLNAAGDVASYLYTPLILGKPSSQQERLVLVKINGKWYLKTEFGDPNTLPE